MEGRSPTQLLIEFTKIELGKLPGNLEVYLGRLLACGSALVGGYNEP